MSHPIQKCEDLKIYTRSYQLAMNIFHITRQFPKEETYSLTSQIIRSSRSVPANIKEGFAKRRYEFVFIRHLTDAIGSMEETETWLNFAKDCAYISEDQYTELLDECKQIASMIFRLSRTWKKLSNTDQTMLLHEESTLYSISIEN